MFDEHVAHPLERGRPIHPHPQNHLTSSHLPEQEIDCMNSYDDHEWSLLWRVLQWKSEWDDTSLSRESCFTILQSLESTSVLNKSLIISLDNEERRDHTDASSNKQRSVRISSLSGWRRYTRNENYEWIRHGWRIARASSKWRVVISIKAQARIWFTSKCLYN